MFNRHRVRGLLEDMGVRMRIRASTDSSAAVGISKRRGLGKVRHLELNQLWLQDKVNSQEVEVRKVNGEDNLSDALTNHVDQNSTGRHMQGTGQSFREGRHMLAPNA